ncbi:putative AC transposase [Bienertia sinuspersici]
MKSSNSKKRPIETLQQDDDEDDDVAVLETSTPQHDEGKVGACRSLVWKDMERLESTDKSETKARCLHCKAILTAKSKSGTSHLKRHLDNDRMDAYSIWMSRKEKFSVDKSQLDLYLEEKNVDHKSKLDVLAWWKNYGAPRHPQLAALARDILAIPISSVPSESAFSMGKKLINPWRASLASMTIETLACYEDWLRAKGFSFGRSLFDVQEDEDEDENEDVVNKDDCEVLD